MSRQTRRRVLRTAGFVALGGSLTAGALGRLDETVAPDAVAWHETYGDGDYQCHAVVDTQDGVLVLGRTGNDRSATPWLAEVAADGEPKWTTTFDTPGFTRAVDATPHNDGFTVLATTDGSPAIRLVRLDGNGQEVWRRSLAGPEGMPVDSGKLVSASNTLRENAQVLASVRDGYLIGGFRGQNPIRADAPGTHAWVRAVDTAGETSWTRTYEGTSVADISKLDDGYLLAGNARGDAWLQAVETDGEPRWQHAYGGVATEGAAVAVPTANGILYGGRSGSGTARHSRAILVRTTADGEFVWRRTRDPQHVTDLLPFGDGFVLTGEPPSTGRVGRNPEKPVSVVDRWGRVQQTATVSLDPGAPTGLGLFDDGSVAVGGWDGDSGIWLAKIDF